MELDDASVVGDLFCACAVGDGLILKEGWRYLFTRYGFERILEIDNRNWEWFSNERLKLIEISKMDGYDPISDRFGVWDDELGFVPASG
ncbi:hypothetical protein N9Y42_09320 [Mariniblastus sp.]|nr:hypothetical protein [Mariniblastus sp.]